MYVGEEKVIQEECNGTLKQYLFSFTEEEVSVKQNKKTTKRKKVNKNNYTENELVVHDLVKSKI